LLENVFSSEGGMTTKSVCVCEFDSIFSTATGDGHFRSGCSSSITGIGLEWRERIPGTPVSARVGDVDSSRLMSPRSIRSMSDLQWQQSACFRPLRLSDLNMMIIRSYCVCSSKIIRQWQQSACLNSTKLCGCREISSTSNSLPARCRTPEICRRSSSRFTPKIPAEYMWSMTSDNALLNELLDKKSTTSVLYCSKISFKLSFVSRPSSEFNSPKIQINNIFDY